MRIILALILFTVCSFTSGADESPDANKVQQQLQGKWEVVETKPNGMLTLTKDPQIFTVIIEVDRVFFARNGKPDKESGWTVKLDLATKPWGIDLIPFSGEDKGKVFHCAFELDGDQLRICGENKPDQNKPATVEPKEGSITNFVRLKRLKD